MVNTDSKKQARIKELTDLRDELAKTSKVTVREGWEVYKESKDGRLKMRCQAIMPRTATKGKIVQCKHAAMAGEIICKRHGGGVIKRAKQLKVLKQKNLGLYDIGDKKALQQELKEIEEIPEEQLKEVDDELKLSVALLRKFLKENSDEQIMQAPGKLMYMLDSVVKFKKIHYDMTHAPQFSFTREQVEYMMIQLRMVVIDVVKDSTILKKISDGWIKAATQLKEIGFKIK